MDIKPGSKHFLIRIILKGFLLFVLCNLVFSIINPINYLGVLSGYNFIFPGRKRLPFGERPDLAYNLSISNLPAMFSSHEINGIPVDPEEFRVFIVGDSSVWGYLLTPDETLSEQINKMDVRLPDGRKIHAFNFGYPTLSVTKDLLIVNKVLEYQPDLIVWLVTLDSLLVEKQFTSPLVEGNLQEMKNIYNEYGIPWTIEFQTDPLRKLWETSIIGQRRVLADLFRLQLYGVLWAATGIDQAYPESYEPPKWDLDPDTAYYSFTPSGFKAADLAFDVLQFGIQHKGFHNYMLVNEPVFISSGANHDIRYNFFYPRWAYDRYREMMISFTCQNNISYLDAWNTVSSTNFTNSAIHLNTEGTRILSQEIVDEIQNHLWNKDP